MGVSEADVEIVNAWANSKTQTENQMYIEKQTEATMLYRA